MRLHEKFDIGQLTILGLVNEVKSQGLKKDSPSKIKDMENNMTKHKERNEKIKGNIKFYQNLIQSLKRKSKNVKKYTYYDRLEMEYKIERAQYNIEKEKKKIVPVEHLENRLKKHQGKDFYYFINDGFETYKLKRSEIVKMQDNSYFIKRFERNVNKAIKKLETSSDPQKKAKIKILRDKLLKVITFNKEVDKHGKEDFSKLDEELQEEVELMLDSEMEKADKGGRYPINVFLSEELIIINQ